MRGKLAVIALIAALPCAVLAGGASLAEGVTLAWTDSATLALTAEVPLPNGCHQPGAITLSPPPGQPAIAHSVAVTLNVTVTGDICTQEYRVHPFTATLSIPADTAAVIVYEQRSGQDIKAAAYVLPRR